LEKEIWDVNTWNPLQTNLGTVKRTPGTNVVVYHSTEYPWFTTINQFVFTAVYVTETTTISVTETTHRLTTTTEFVSTTVYVTETTTISAEMPTVFTQHIRFDALPTSEGLALKHTHTVDVPRHSSQFFFFELRFRFSAKVDCQGSGMLTRFDLQTQIGVVVYSMSFDNVTSAAATRWYHISRKDICKRVDGGKDARREAKGSAMTRM